MTAQGVDDAMGYRRPRIPAPAARPIRASVVAGALLAAALSGCATLRGGSGSSPYYQLASATDLDTINGLATLPVYAGTVRGRTVWYIVTESSDRADAARRGVTWSPRLKALDGTAAVQRAKVVAATMQFDAGVDFAPDRSVVANPDSAFPPASAAPGSVAEPFYSPFARLDDGTVINAPIVADEFAAGDRVEWLSPATGRVRIRLSRGYATGQTVWYTSPDASEPVVAAMERATFAPALRAAPGEGATNSIGSARTGILAVINGETGRDNPERQGLRSAILDERTPLNILEHSPDPTQRNAVYSPAWDLHLVRWTADAIARNQRGKIFGWAEALALVSAGVIVAEGAGAAPTGAPALRPARVVINCPVIAIFVRRPQ